MPAYTVGTYDVGGDNRLNLLAAINATNQTQYDLVNFRFTDPQRVTIATPTHNTSIKIGPLASTGMVGFKTIYYNRIHANDIGPLTITWQNEQYLTELLGRLSQKYGLSIQPEDVYEQVIVPPAPGVSDVSITLNFRETSVAYYGGTEIVMGTRDPSLEFELPETMPFKNDLVFFVNDFSPSTRGRQYHKSSVVSVAADKVRIKTMSVNETGTSRLVNIVKNTFTNDERKRLESYMPFVYTWRVGDTMIIRGVNIYGDVVEINETTSSVTKLQSLVAINPNDPLDIEIARNKILVREGTQDVNGDVYIIVGNPDTNQVNIKRSTDFGTTFTNVTMDAANRASLNYANMQNTIIYDLVARNGIVHVLVKNPASYGVIPGKSAVALAVEVFDIANGTSNFFPVSTGLGKNVAVGLDFTQVMHARFVTAEEDVDTYDVVCVANTSRTKERVLTYSAREAGGEYNSEILPTKYLDHSVYGLAAWSKPLAKDPLGLFVSVELLTEVPTGTMDELFAITTNVTSLNGPLGYGVATMTCQRSGVTHTPWTESFVDIGGGSSPIFTTVTDRGLRNHYVFSGGRGIFMVEYTEDVMNGYIPRLREVVDLGSNPGFKLESDIGNGSYVTPTVEEEIQLTALYDDHPAEEQLKNPIQYSFLARNRVTDETMWLVAALNESTLSERELGAEYGNLGRVPSAVISNADSTLLAWTGYQGIYSSNDGGNTWTDFSAVRSYYSNPKFLGRALVDLKPSDFKRVVAKDQIVFAEIQPVRTTSTFNLETNTTVPVLALADRVIYRVDGGSPTGGVEIDGNYLTNPFNSTSDFSPRQVMAWDTDASNNIRALARYTDGGNVTYLNQLSILGVPEADVLHVYSDVGFLGLKAVVITHSDSEGHNLWLVKEDDTLVRHGLRFANAPVFPDFVPNGILPMWSGNVDAISYTPIVITSAGKDVLIIERDGLAGNTATVTLSSFTLAGDNAKAVQWVPMFTANRNDMLIYQEDNGVFVPEYVWDGASTTSSVVTTKLFDTAGLNLGVMYSGCQQGVDNVVPYDETTIGPWDPAGTVLGEDCQGFDRRERVSDGYGGYYWRVLETNSTTCGFVVPAPGNVGSGGGNFNIGG